MFIVVGVLVALQMVVREMRGGGGGGGVGGIGRSLSTSVCDGFVFRDAPAG